MNKIIIDNNEYNIENYEGELVLPNDATLNFTGASYVYIINNEVNVELNLFTGANVTINMFSKNKINSSKIIIKQSENSFLRLVNSYENTAVIDDVYEVNYMSDNNQTDIIVNALALKNVNIKASAFVKKETKNNNVLESIKAYQSGGNVFIEPILCVETCNVIANHKAVITNLENDDMFYLKSKGLDDNLCQKIIKEGFMIKDFSDKFKEKIRKEFYE